MALFGGVGSGIVSFFHPKIAKKSTATRITSSVVVGTATTISSVFTGGLGTGLTQCLLWGVLGGGGVGVFSNLIYNDVAGTQNSENPILGPITDGSVLNETRGVATSLPAPLGPVLDGVFIFGDVMSSIPVNPQNGTNSEGRSSQSSQS